MLIYFENIVCIDEDEYNANYNTTYGVEIGNNLTISTVFRLLVEDFLINPHIDIDYRYLEYFSKKLKQKKFLYGLNYIKNCVFSYMNEETPKYHNKINLTGKTLEDLERYKKYFKQLFKTTHEYIKSVKSSLKKYDYTDQRNITLYNNRFSISLSS